MRTLVKNIAISWLELDRKSRKEEYGFPTFSMNTGSTKL